LIAVFAMSDEGLVTPHSDPAEKVIKILWPSHRIFPFSRVVFIVFPFGVCGFSPSLNAFSSFRFYLD